MRSDQEINRDVEESLRKAPDVDETDIAVKVTNAVVALRGVVQDVVDRYEAERVARHVAGVRAVANDLQVRCLGQRTQRA